MSESFSGSFRISVTEGPLIGVSGTMDVDAYTKLEATVPQGSPGTVTVNVQPGDDAQFMLIASSSYDDLTYEVDSSGTTVTLDGPHILVGEGAVSLLGNTQNQIEFSNNGSEDVTVTILVGRNATS